MSPIVGGRRQRAPPGEWVSRPPGVVARLRDPASSTAANPPVSGLGGVALRCNHAGMAGRVAIRFGWLIALTAVVLSWALVARTMANPSPVAKSPSKATAVVWGGLVFTDVRPLAHWLHTHGVAYSVWTARHPRAAKTFHKRKARSCI
jgi:hypothetical protein